MRARSPHLLGQFLGACAKNQSFATEITQSLSWCRIQHVLPVYFCTRDTLGMVVAVNKPYEGVIPGVRPPLLKGMYASVEFLAQPRDLLVIPRKALHESRVYVVSKQNTLSIRPVQVSYSQGQLVVIKQGLKEGDKIITSDIVPVIEGIKLELIESDALQKEIAALALGSK